MGIGRIDINGSFITSTVVQPGSNSGDTTLFHKGASSRGKGSIAITVHTAMGARVHLTKTLSSDVERTLVLGVVQDGGSSTILNQLNSFISGEKEFHTINIAVGDVITKCDVDIQGKLDTASINGNNSEFGILLAEQMYGVGSGTVESAAALRPEGFSANFSTYSGAETAAGGSGYGTGTVVIAAPGRGHLGEVGSVV